MRTRLLLLVLVPLAPVLELGFGLPPVVVFVAGILGVGVTADWIRVATDELARHTGPAIGGLLTISLGSLAELMLALFVLAGGEIAVVHAQITGSIIATSLLGLGLAIVVGSIGRERQVFKRERASQLGTMLILVSIALLLPAVFDFAARQRAQTAQLAAHEEGLSLLVSAVLLALYLGNLAYTLVTHRDVFASGEPAEPEGTSWPVWRCLAVLGAATAAAAWDSELVSDALTAAASSLHLSTVFLGVIVLALVGTIADLFSAVYFARQDRMGLVMSICVGSAIQMALVVAPLLVILSWLIGKPMNLVFSNPLDLFAIAGTALIVNAVTADGETTWFEGVLLLGVYAVIGIAFYFS